MAENLDKKLKDLVNLLAELVQVPAPSGYEEPMMRWCADRFRAFADEVETDVRGNVYATFRGATTGAPKVMLPAHMDTLGMIVKSIDARGFIRFVSGTLALAMCSRRVRIHGANGPVLGVIGIRIGYGTSKPEQLARAPDEKDLYIDVGCSSPDKAAALGIRVGDPVTFDGDLARLGDARHVVSPYLDNRTGIAALVTLAGHLKSVPHEAEVVLVGTIEEEIGLRGASTAAFRLEPDVGIAVDTVPAGGTPEYDLDRFPVVIGKGPVIKFTENARTTNHPRVRRLLVEAAEKAGVPYQLVAAPPGGTDMGAMEQAGPGIPAAAIGLPRRYAHSPNEVIDIRDLLGLVTILKGAIDILGSGYSLQRV